MKQNFRYIKVQVVQGTFQKWSVLQKTRV